MAKVKSLKSRRVDALSSMKSKVKAHVDKNGASDGLVRVYPVGARNDDGEQIDAEARVPTAASVVQDVDPDKALDLVSHRPAAFTLYESGNALEEHAELDEVDSLQAWGVAEPEDAEDEENELPPVQPVATGQVDKPAKAEKGEQQA